MEKIKSLAIKILVGYLGLILMLSFSAIVLNLLCTQNTFKTSEIINMFWIDGLYFGCIKAINAHVILASLCLTAIIQAKRPNT